MLSAATASSSRAVGIRSANTAEASLSDVEICDESTMPPKRCVVAITSSATDCTSPRDVDSCSVVLRSTLRPETGRGAVAACGAPARDSEGALWAATPAPEDEVDSVDEPPPPPVTTISAITTAAATPIAGDQAGHDGRLRALRAASTRASSFAANSGRICGRSARTSATSSVNREGSPASARSSSSRSAWTMGSRSVRMAGLPELGDGTVQAGARGGLADADDLRDLGI